MPLSPTPPKGRAELAPVSGRFQLITPARTFFDYGSGLGKDIQYLRTKKIDATGWDPFYAPSAEKKRADIVNLGYVLNVIERPEERQQTLIDAFDLANQLLIVSVRVDKAIGYEEFGDGQITSRNTFQKIFGQIEFRDYVQSVLGHKLHMESMGIGYVFKDKTLESTYLANVAFSRGLEYRTDLVDQFSKGHFRLYHPKFG